MREANGKLEYTYQYSTHDPKVSMTLSPETPLGDAIEAFEAFLRAAGYSFAGHVEINGNYDPTLHDPNAEQN